jgi:hypothetical protein
MIFRRYLSAALFFTIFNCSVAQIKTAFLITDPVSQYEKAEWNILLTGEWKNPYFKEDIALDMEVRSPSGRIITIPCFYSSGESGLQSNWKARFSPGELGKYTCKFKLSKFEKTFNELTANSFTVKASGKKGILHANDNYTFIFDNNELFRGLGENLCWESRSNDDSKFFKTLHENPRFNYEFLLRKLAANGGNFTRIWISPWNFPLEWHTVSPNTNRYSNSNEFYNPSAIAKLDRLFELSDSLGIYIMLTLNGTGGFEESNYGIKGGGLAENDSAFFVNPECREQYKNKLRYLIARWGYSGSLGAWEFYNEVNWFAFGHDTSDKQRPRSAVAWHDEMSTYLRENDPYRHLITTSIAQTEVPGLNSVKNIDFNQIHIYSNIIDLFEIPALISQHIAEFHKPYVIGEFAHESDWMKNFDLFAREMDSDFKRGLWLGLFSPTPILPMSWWWEYFENRGMMSYFKNVRQILDKMMMEGKGKFQPERILCNIPDVKSYALKCGNARFVYLYNDSKDSIQVSFMAEIDKPVINIQQYSCETGEYHTVEGFVQKENWITIPAALSTHSDEVFIIK